MNPDLARALAMLGFAVRALAVSALRLVEVVAGLLARLIARGHAR
jgi:hypothetical protein